MSTITAPPPGPDSAAAPSAAPFDPNTLSSAQLADAMRGAEAIRSGRASAPAPAAPAAKETPPATETPKVDPEAPEAKPEAKETPAEQTPAAKQPTPEETAAEKEAALEVEHGRKILRPRLSNEEDIAISLIAKRQGITLREATRIYEKGLESRTAETKATETPKPDPVAEIDTSIKTTTEQIAATRAELKKASEDMDSEKVAELTEKLTDQKLALHNLQGRKEQTISQRETAQQQKAQDAETADYQKVIERYPDLRPPKEGEQKGPVREKFEAFMEQQLETSPLFRREGDRIVPLVPNWRSILVREFAEENNLSPATAAKTPAAPAKTDNPPPATQPRRAAAATVLTTGDAPSSSSTFEATPEEVSQAIDKMTPAQLGQLMRETDRLKKSGGA